MGLEHALVIQPPLKLSAVRDRGHRSETLFKALVQGLVAGDRSCRGVILTAGGEEKQDHVFRVAVPPWAHVDRDPGFDVVLPKQCEPLVRDLGVPQNALYFLEKFAGGTRALVRLCGLLGLEVSLQPLGVWGRGGLSVMGGHLGTVARCAYIVSGFMGTKR